MFCCPVKAYLGMRFALSEFELIVYYLRVVAFTTLPFLPNPLLVFAVTKM